MSLSWKNAATRLLSVARLCVVSVAPRCSMAGVSPSSMATLLVPSAKSKQLKTPSARSSPGT